jgi:hypothetical protein
MFAAIPDDGHNLFADLPSREKWVTFLDGFLHPAAL